MLPNFLSSQMTPMMVDENQDPISLESMLAMLPKVRGRKRKAAQLRKIREQFEEMSQQPGNPNYVPTQDGGLFQTVGQYIPDYAGATNKAIGALGSYLTGRQEQQAEEEYESMQGGEILNTLEQLGQTREEGYNGPAEQTLRGYLGMLGGPEGKELGLPGAVKARATQIDQEGNVWTQMTDGTWQPAGFKARSGMRVITDPVTGQVYQVPTTTAGEAGEVTLGGSGAPASAPVAPGGAGPAPAVGPNGQPFTASLDTLTPEQNQLLTQIMSTMPQEQADAFFNQVAGGAATARQFTAPNAGPRPLRLSTAGEEAAAKEQGKIQTQLQYADQTGAAAAAEKGMVVDAETAAKARASLPQAQLALSTVQANAKKLLEHPGLSQIVGGMGGRIPDGPTAQKYFNAIMAGTSAADAMALHNQAKGRVFLEAYQLLKGGGQITEVEGLKAEQAMARMDRAQSLEAYKQAVMDFVSAVESGFMKVQQTAQGGAAAPAPPPAPAARPALPPGFSWED